MRNLSSFLLFVLVFVFSCATQETWNFKSSDYCLLLIPFKAEVGDGSPLGKTFSIESSDPKVLKITFGKNFKKFEAILIKSDIAFDKISSVNANNFTGDPLELSIDLHIQYKPSSVIVSPQVVNYTQTLISQTSNSKTYRQQIDLIPLTLLTEREILNAILKEPKFSEWYEVIKLKLDKL